MNQDNPFAVLARDDPPTTDWTPQPGEIEPFDSFGLNQISFDFPGSLNFPAMEIECPIPHVPICDFSELFQPPPPPRLEARHAKVQSAPAGPEWFLWNAVQPPASAHPRHLRHCSLSGPPSAHLDSDAEFDQVCSDPAIVMHPHKLGFIPTQFWSDKSLTFGQLVKDFFQRKNHANSRFSHKLYNALKITVDDPFYVDFVGIEWVTDTVLRIDKRVFARLLAIKTIDGSLFHQQGNFPSHGFFELTEETGLEFVSRELLDSVDFDNVRLLVHQDRVFTRNCTEEDIGRCKWISVRKRNLPANNGAE
jgi:hypothetical protein